MGLNTKYLSFFESSINEVFGSEVSGLRMLELGDQLITDPNIVEKTGKDYFTKRGYEHVSVDINGLHGAEVRDLSKPEQFQDLHGSWDILTNAGTTEHVEPYESQYECYNILHDCLKVGGIAIHLVPDVYERDEHGRWINHCRYYYSKSFFEMLAKECEYELLSTSIINGHRCAVLRKTKDTPFMNNRLKFLSLIEQRDYIPENLINRIGRSILRQIGVGRFLKRIGLRPPLR